MLSTNLNGSSKLKERRGRDARRRLFRPLRLETLEHRRLMDAGGNTLATATDLGSLQGSRMVSDYVGPADRDDYFRFSVSGQAPVDVRLDQLSSDADLTLLNANGGMIRSSA
ncbi:MAG: PPC domain-containing protein [Planctomycetota bacterium]|nr:PPC domain-containing protein [Planctomycetota bacterium]